MSEDKELKQWKEKLFYQPKNGYDRIDAEQAGEIFAYAEGYKQFLDAARTEREAVKEAIRMAEAEGFVPYTFGMELQPGSKVYVNNRGKALMLAVLGELGITVLNTGSLYVDSLIYGYYSPVFVFGTLPLRLAICAGKGIVLALLLPTLLRITRRALQPRAN